MESFNKIKISIIFVKILTPKKIHLYIEKSVYSKHYQLARSCICTNKV